MNASCYFCGTNLTWLEEQEKESYGYVGKGMVVHLHCPECGADVLCIENGVA